MGAKVRQTYPEPTTTSILSSLEGPDISKLSQRKKIRILVLESMGFLWSERESQWQRMFNRLEAYLYQHGTLDVDRDQSPILWAWVDQQRKNYQKGKVPEERIALLEAIGFVFDLHEAS